ncbi:heme lyase CcmF/NrfE family subunit [Noviherbaspirillum sp. CPCC 100848]|uniref:Heme lyase CcmF/NrfE family subunit n=1 Tax=Noviherbaspirillum album TaxID=3080276 RepID=A0ABU6JIW4_9BURK|nr:heme lyase CcmF/NrfE family subunit [Noviherbaspirillum sp. CPCC 100848]MEC4723638.1 heme lyase CcmF/NrfE family subunit [Noviherbaspirillum sp. CPCC 100848]
MIPELGNFAAMLALCVAVVQGALPLAGAARGNAQWMATARPAAAAQLFLIAFAFGCLVHAFVSNDFSVIYVAANSNTQLPLHYRVTATWGGHEGSLLLWIFMLSLWSFSVARFSRQLPREMTARVLGVLGLISTGFLAFLLFTSNPFDRLLPAVSEGKDLNPLLQDFGMIIHPPLLYMGYVGFSVAFAFGIAALLGGKLDAAWARWSRPWTTLAWMFLTLGIFMGSFWAYYELGWGGWWFWDPVENASFMPWLVGTALIHSLAVTEKRGTFKNWTVLLAIIAFSLSLLGTFLVRSGVLTSVHAFATDPERGIFILAFLALVIGGSLLLYAIRAPEIGNGGTFSLLSRESALLLNNIFLLVASGTILLGTLYPLFLDALGLGKISVGPPYFEAVFVPLMVPVLIAMAAGPFLRWKEDDLRTLLKKCSKPAALSLLCAAIVFIVLALSPAIAAGIACAAWILFATAIQLLDRLRGGATENGWARRVTNQPLSFWGMLVAHAGIGIFVVGVTLSRGLDEAKDTVMRVGDVATLGTYTFTLRETKEVAGPNYRAVQAIVDVADERDRNGIATLTPEKRLYQSQQMPMTEAAIHRGLTRDLYVSLGEMTSDQQWIVRLQHKPFLGWIWAGCLIMAAGGLLAVMDRRYRIRARKASVSTVINVNPAGVTQS